MPKSLRTFVRITDRFNRGVGRLTMYMIFVMIGVLLYSSISKTFFLPAHWTLETSQFLMVAYFLLGGAYSLQLAAHVRMDLAYGVMTKRRQTWLDCFTIMFLFLYLGVLLYGAISSTTYSLTYGERSPTAWRPYLSPIKIIMTIGIALTFIQALSLLIKKIAWLRGEDWDEGNPSIAERVV